MLHIFPYELHCQAKFHHKVSLQLLWLILVRNFDKIPPARHGLSISVLLFVRSHRDDILPSKVSVAPPHSHEGQILGSLIPDPYQVTRLPLIFYLHHKSLTLEIFY